jgi:hypothetical protein
MYTYIPYPTASKEAYTFNVYSRKAHNPWKFILVLIYVDKYKTPHQNSTTNHPLVASITYVRSPTY